MLTMKPATATTVDAANCIRVTNRGSMESNHSTMCILVEVSHVRRPAPTRFAPGLPLHMLRSNNRHRSRFAARQASS